MNKIKIEQLIFDDREYYELKLNCFWINHCVGRKKYFKEKFGIDI